MDRKVSMGERHRQAALNRYDILDTPAEEVFDRITRIACRLFGVPMSTMTLIDADRQWFKSRQGVDACQTPRGDALCDVTIREERPLVVRDTLRDPRFVGNPLVVAGARLRFYAGAPLRTTDGHAIGTLCILDTKPRDFDDADVDMLVDLSQVVMRELELRLIATTDGLTGAMTRRAFRDAFVREFVEATRHGHDLSCIIFDIDHFKGVNDRLGHAVGDRVLKQAVVGCRDTLAGRLIGRIGGEEFAVLLPRASMSDALAVAERLRMWLPPSTAVGLTLPEGATASFGVASLDESTPNIDAILRRADTALYAAKNGGRNRCIAWSPAANAVWPKAA